MIKIKTILALFVILNFVACSDNSSEQTVEHHLHTQKDNTIEPIKDRVVAGNVRNTKFEVEKAIINNGTLTLRQGKEFFADVSIDIVTF